ncbi:MAG: transcriptional repressor NrdR [Phormidesmis sp. RL_2_1]|nr:transcriptional repressor NrdR [Phormidesmis sp. RL_2_1]
MQCPFCQHPNNRVLESRSAESDRSIRRRRECMECERRFTTYERIEYVPITVIKRQGDRESFDRSKLLRGIVTACEKTGVTAHAIERLVDEIEAELQQKAVRDVTSEEIGEQVLAHLQHLSEVAYVRFASVYQQFQGIRDFTETLSQLKMKQRKRKGKSVSESVSGSQVQGTQPVLPSDSAPSSESYQNTPHQNKPHQRDSTGLAASFKV